MISSTNTKLLNLVVGDEDASYNVAGSPSFIPGFSEVKATSQEKYKLEPLSIAKDRKQSGNLIQNGSQTDDVGYFT